MRIKDKLKNELINNMTEFAKEQVGCWEVFRILQRIINEWNQLSADFVHASGVNGGVNMFRNTMSDKYHIRAGFTQESTKLMDS